MIKGLKIEAPNTFFENATTIDLFWDEDPNASEQGKKNFSVIFGKNGSGKTSLSNLLFDYKKDLETHNLLEFYDDNQQIVSINKENLHVFNEKFIEEYVQISKEKDSINAIVLLGKTKEIDGKINEQNEIIEREVKNIETRNINQYHQKLHDNCIDDYYNKIKDQLKNTWALRQQRIKKLTNKAPVKDDFVVEMLEFSKSKKSVKELDKEFELLVNKLNNIREVSYRINEISIDISIKDVDFYNSLLATSFDKKAMSAFSLKVLESIEHNNSKYLVDSRIVLENEKLCPMCFQEIKEEHKSSILTILGDLFDKTIEDETEKIQNAIITKPIIVPDFSPYKSIVSQELIDLLSDQINSMNHTIEIINKYLKEKIGAIYSPHKMLNIDLKKEISELQDTEKKINKVIQDFNMEIANRNKIIDRATMINKELSFYGIENLVDIYNRLCLEEKTAIQENEKSNQIIRMAKENIENLKLEKQNYSIALKEINVSLSYIFGTNKKLQLKATESGDKYYIYSKNKKLKYSKLSTGERNIIGLVYFYESLKCNCIEGQYFKTESLFVIDDPISSFDYENKIGILSFLKKVIREINEGNEKSQVVILTHELEVVGFISKVFSDLNVTKKACSRELVNKTTKRINPNKYTSYGSLFLDVYHYIVDKDYRDRTKIGNTIRRLIEAYSYFNYNESIDKFLTKSDYYSKISDKDCREYFMCRMNRLVMNEGSHSENIIRQAPDTFNFDLFDDDTIIKTAKDIICLLYLLDSNHVKRYLTSESKAINLIESWIKDIKSLFVTN